MKEMVVLKSYPHGIVIRMEGEAPFEEILRELEHKFTQSRAFFGDVSLAVSLEGRELSPQEEIQILNTIRSSSDVKVMCIVGKDEGTERIFVKALRQMEKKLQGDQEGQFYRGSLKNHDRLETETNVIILGDVYPGCSVVSARNIIILGGLYGSAYAGGNGKKEHYVVALEMEPESLGIGDFKYQTRTRGRRRGILKSKVQPEVAYVKNKRIVFEPLTKELLDGF